MMGAREQLQTMEPPPAVIPRSLSQQLLPSAFTLGAGGFLDPSRGLSFLELLSLEDLHQPSSFPSELPDPPETSNPSSFSSSSIDAAGGGEVEINGKCKEDEDEEGRGEEKREKKKKTTKGQKRRPKQPRVSFKTRSEVDHLEDGYRWRKYGQKTVKNSPYPRSYFRCTSVRCGVKKRVERSPEDPAAVLTTYEGQHTHPIPATLRGALRPPLPSAEALPALGFGLPSPEAARLYLPLLGSHIRPPQSLHNRYLAVPRPFSAAFDGENAICRDQGLLQDVIPVEIRKEDA